MVAGTEGGSATEDLDATNISTESLDSSLIAD
jgi:hypothetical protein